MPYTFIKPIRKSVNINSLICRDHHGWLIERVKPKIIIISSVDEISLTLTLIKKERIQVVRYDSFLDKSGERNRTCLMVMDRYFKVPHKTGNNKVSEWIHIALELYQCSTHHYDISMFSIDKSMTTIPCPLCHVSISYVLCCWWWMTDCVNTPIKL